MRRVVVTGLGIVSSLGTDLEEVSRALYDSRSGLVHDPAMKEFGMKCCVFGAVKGFNAEALTNRAKLTASQVAQYALYAALAALRDARLDQGEIQNERCGILVGSSFGGINEAFKTERFVVRKRPSRAGLTGLVKGMNSTTSGNLAAFLGSKGHASAISSSFASGLDNVGHAYELINCGLQDMCICGSAEQEVWRQVGAYFDNAGAMANKWNDHPAEACRPYDRERQGFIMSAGAGILILEALEAAEKRGSSIYSEIVGYGSANDGSDLFRPSGEGLKYAMKQALVSASKQGVNGLDYINGHGTGTPLGDRVEVRAIRDVFGSGAPLLSSTKGLAGHGLGATGAQEAVYSLLMLKNNFIAPTVNLKDVDGDCSGVPHVQSLSERELGSVMTINVGLGGTASCLIFRKL
jgi:3-oxoacyl-[acyl-carrier-protein] synthase-1